MRAYTLIFNAVLVASVAWGPCCSAEGKGDNAVPKLGSGRVGTLSPDEERRAARARQRATAAPKSTQTEHVENRSHAKRDRTQNADVSSDKVSVQRRRAPVRRAAQREGGQRAMSERLPGRKREVSARIRRQAIRGPFDGGRMSGPRIGDAVPPPGIRLYPLPPPGYGLGGDGPMIAGPYPRRPYYPPFPRPRYDEDYDPDVE